MRESRPVGMTPRKPKPLAAAAPSAGRAKRGYSTTFDVPKLFLTERRNSMKVRHQIDDSILLPQRKKLIAAAAVTAVIAAGVILAPPTHDQGLLKTPHDAMRHVVK